MIGNISIQNFRNILNLNLVPNNINLITGKMGSGKSSLLEAIALTDASDREFHAILRRAYHEPTRVMDFKELVYLNFFTHREDIESFRVHLAMKTGRSRLFEIWKTCDGMAKSLEMKLSKESPFVFVFDSVEPKQIVPRSVQSIKMEQIYKAFLTSFDQWPIHFVGPDRTNSISLLSKHYRVIRNRIKFINSMKNFTDHFSDIESLSLIKTLTTETLAVKMKDRQKSVPLYGCPESIVRALTLLIFLHSTNKPYFLIDDIDRGLEDEDLRWLAGEICRISLDRNIQLFVTTRHTKVVDAFEQALNGNTSLLGTFSMNPICLTDDVLATEI